MNKEHIAINETLVRHLVASQFPQWKDLPIRPVTHSGWDNRTFHLGERMLVRMPSAEATIKRLLNIAWWNWDIQKINKNLICSLDVDRLEAVSK